MHFVVAGDAAGEAIRGDVECGVRVGHFDASAAVAPTAPVPPDARGLTFKANNSMRTLCPDPPVAEQAADNVAVGMRAARCVSKRNGVSEVADDVVVVAGVERDVVAAGFGDGADDIDRLIPIEGRRS